MLQKYTPQNSAIMMRVHLKSGKLELNSTLELRNSRSWAPTSRWFSKYSMKTSLFFFYTHLTAEWLLLRFVRKSINCVWPLIFDFCSLHNVQCDDPVYPCETILPITCQKVKGYVIKNISALYMYLILN